METLQAPKIKQATSKRIQTKSWIEAAWLNREAIAWIIIIILAALTRLTDLGPRALHQDEATHAGSFTRGMYLNGQFYSYDPTFHGPFLYYMVSLSFFLFGDANDTTARVAPAVFGIGIVALCWYLRALIGKAGALFAGIFILISPSILYYSRNLRHDAFAVFGELLFAIGVFRFFSSRKASWLTAAGIGLVITYASHELVFMNTAILVGWLIFMFAVELVGLPAKFARQKKPIAIVETEFFGDEKTIESVSVADFSLENVGEIAEEAKPATRTFSPRLLISIGLFLIFAGALALNSKDLLSSTAPKLFSSDDKGGISAGIVIIPLVLAISVIAAFLLTQAYDGIWKRLERTPRRIALVGSVLAFGGLGAFQAYRTFSPAKAKVDSTTELTAATATTPATTTDKISSLSLSLVIILLLALFIGPLLGWLWQRRFLVLNRTGIIGFAIAFTGTWLVAALVSLRFLGVDPLKGGIRPKGGLLLIGPEVDKWVAYIFNGFFLALGVGIVAGWLVSLAKDIPDEKLRGSAALRGILGIFRNPLALAGFFGSFAIIYILLFGNFFFYPQGLADGIYKGVEYWAGVHDTRRIDQPWFYYPMLMLLYEILPLILSIIALFAFPIGWIRRSLRKGRPVFTTRGLFAGYCAWWSVLAIITYSIAGEKVPWLNMQVALPAILTSAVFFDNQVRRISWRKLLKPSQGLLFGGIAILMFIAIAISIGFLSNLTGSLPDTTSNLPVYVATTPDNSIVGIRLGIAVLAALVALSFFGISLWLWRSKRISGKLMRAMLVLLFSIALGIYGIKATLMLNYNNPVTNVEPMIQVQTTPELINFVERVDKLSSDYRESWRRATTDTAARTKIVSDPAGSKEMPILLAQSVAPPLAWYFRKYPYVGYFTPNNDSNQNSDAAPPKDSRGIAYAVIVLDRGEDQFKLQEQMRDNYTRMLFRRYWWLPEDDNGYLGIGKAPADSTNPNLDKKNIKYTDWGKLWDTFTRQPSANLMWRYALYRELQQSLPSYDMVVYVRNDLAPDFMLLGGLNYTGTTKANSPTTDTFAYKLGEATQAGLKNGQFKVPRALAIAPNGDLLVLDSANGRVQRFDSAGNFLSKFGKIGNGDGLFGIIQNDGGAGGIAIDEQGNIYVSDSWNYRIEKFDSSGKFLMKWGEGYDNKGDLEQAKTQPKGFYGPRGIFYDTTRKELYVADTGNRRVAVFDANGNFLRQFGGRGSGPGQFDEPVSVAVSPSGKVYVTDMRNKRLQILDRDGNYISEIKFPNWRDQYLNEPYVTLDSVGNLFISDPTNARVYKYSPDGSLLQTIESNASLVLENPVGVAVGADGSLYIADAKRNNVYKVKAS
ncbi:MAG: TIGR03663 family protein [Chloroflexi bacterium]|uniref:TIGR03663 family protein n=1 Tax=Candidatus Chlorohelix allophototropha TaxID=3003348 RepID=A0A8T7M4Y9_9CHLR|nr:TIGR03663 family protein [Chloroflexota bacterium]WJW69082.1 TIGR03663 family protein [Chloroflexota bacterium L227-S17]